MIKSAPSDPRIWFRAFLIIEVGAGEDLIVGGGGSRQARRSPSAAATASLLDPAVPDLPQARSSTT
jgi:hypothetical protein